MVTHRMWGEGEGQKGVTGSLVTLAPRPLQVGLVQCARPHGSSRWEEEAFSSGCVPVLNRGPGAGVPAPAPSIPTAYATFDLQLNGPQKPFRRISMTQCVQNQGHPSGPPWSFRGPSVKFLPQSLYIFLNFTYIPAFSRI